MFSVEKVNLYLHIGLHKTGTTALQHFLWDNQQLLAKKGYFYSTLTNHHLPWSLFPKDSFRYKSLKKSPDTIWAELHQKITCSNLTNIILSSEEFCNIKEVDKLGLRLQRYRPKIVVYLRRQDHFVQSIYSQFINDSTTRYTNSIQVFLEWYKSKLDFANFLGLWQETFGREKLLVRVYEQNQLPEGIYADFLKSIGLELTNEYYLPKKITTNQSLNRDALEFLKLCNTIPMDVSEHQKLRQALDEVSNILGRKEYFESHQMLSPREQIEILEEYEDSNRQVAREYLGREDGQLFYEARPNPDESWEVYKGLSVEKIVQIMGVLWYCNKG